MGTDGGGGAISGKSKTCFSRKLPNPLWGPLNMNGYPGRGGRVAVSARVKQKREGYDSTPSSVEVKNVFMALRLVKHRGNFSLFAAPLCSALNILSRKFRKKKCLFVRWI
jgi:hypothetical protein